MTRSHGPKQPFPFHVKSAPLNYTSTAYLDQTTTTSIYSYKLLRDIFVSHVNSSCTISCLGSAANSLMQTVVHTFYLFTVQGRRPPQMPAYLRPFERDPKPLKSRHYAHKRREIVLSSLVLDGRRKSMLLIPEHVWAIKMDSLSLSCPIPDIPNFGIVRRWPKAARIYNHTSTTLFFSFRHVESKLRNEVAAHEVVDTPEPRAKSHGTRQAIEGVSKWTRPPKRMLDDHKIAPRSIKLDFTFPRPLFHRDTRSKHLNNASIDLKSPRPKKQKLPVAGDMNTDMNSSSNGSESTKAVGSFYSALPRRYQSRQQQSAQIKRASNNILIPDGWGADVVNSFLPQISTLSTRDGDVNGLSAKRTRFSGRTL